MPDPTPPPPRPERRIGPYEKSLIEDRARREAREAEQARRAARLRSRIILGVLVVLLLAAGVVGGLLWRSAREAAPTNGQTQRAHALVAGDHGHDRATDARRHDEGPRPR
ncbi:hypothetical protein [Terrabacter sp. NPDC080008]|uniref:hypothetical protein n=1 Tax=Terrabacter sp. NPDC080008 TaxID=3155176 RepID=UPI00344EDBE1